MHRLYVLSAADILWSWCPSLTLEIVAIIALLLPATSTTRRWFPVNLAIVHAITVLLAHIDRIHRLLHIISHSIELCKHHLICHISCALDWLQHLIEFAWMLVLSIMLLLQVLDHFIYTWFFEIIFPKLKDSLISTLDGLLSEVLSCLFGDVAFKRIAQEIQPLEHHDVCGLILMQLSWFTTDQAIIDWLTSFT